MLAEALSSALVALAFGSGLVPSVMRANSAAFETLAAGVADDEPPASSLEPCLRNSAILGYARPLTIPDVLAVASRLRGDDFSGLMSRAQFDQSIRAAPPCDWPRDSTGQCVGGDSLRESCGPLASRRLTRIAIDATWTALSGGSSYVASQEVQRQLERWRPDASTFVLDEFERALLMGRANVLLGYTTLFGLQAAVLCVFAVRPLLELAGTPAT